MRMLLATLLSLHALAHLVGFSFPLWINEPLPYGSPDDVGAQFIDDASLRNLSVAWLATAIAFAVAALTRFLGLRSSRDVTTAAAVASLALSIACWPGSFLACPST